MEAVIIVLTKRTTEEDRLDLQSAIVLTLQRYIRGLLLKVLKRLRIKSDLPVAQHSNSPGQSLEDVLVAPLKSEPEN